MAFTPRDARKQYNPTGHDPGRGSPRRQITARPAEWAEIDALAARLARRGYLPNASETIRACVRAVLDAEAEGLVSIEDGRILVTRPRR